MMAILYWVHLPEHTDITSSGYVGITVRTLSQRWSSHKTAAKTESKQHLPIVRAINKYGHENLVIESLVEGSEEYVALIENKLRPSCGIGWNCAVGGQATGVGRKHSPESIAKRVAKVKGIKRSAETKLKQSLASKGKPKSPEHRRKCAIANLGKTRSQEAKDAQRDKMLGRKKITEEGRLKLSEHHKNLKPWKRSRAKFSLWSGAATLFDLFCKGNTLTTGFVRTVLNNKNISSTTIRNMIESGWNPNEDQEYLSWLEEKKGTVCQNIAS